MNIGILISLLFLGFSSSRIIGEKENQVLQSYCGRTPFLQRRIINGKPLEAFENPWAVATQFQYYVQKDGKPKRLVMVFPGTVISPYHILTYNLVRSYDGVFGFQHKEYMTSNGTCLGEHYFLPEEYTDRFDIIMDRSKFDMTRKFQDLVRRVIVINGCPDVNSAKVLILELKKPLELNPSIWPACISNDPQLFDRSSDFSVSGIDAKGVLNSGLFKPVNCSVEGPFSCAEAVDNKQRMCAYDSGGSAISNVSGQNTVLGVYVTGNMNCNANPQNLTDFKFINIANHRESICKLTGICVPDPERIDPTSSALPPTPYEPVGYDGEVLTAEHFDPMRLNGSDPAESIRAERIDPMKLNGSAHHGEGVKKTVSIYINWNKKT